MNNYGNFANSLCCGILILACCGPFSGKLSANPGTYEHGTDPGVGFNLVSWWNFGSGVQVWQNAVQSVFDAGFTEVSLSPVRFYTPGVGSIATSSNSGPELNHVAAGVARAKELGMRVTVNPFIEPVNFSTWRGFYNPTPGSAEWNTFWGDYHQYIVDVAQMAQTGGADSMTVGTELRAITRNSGNNAQWNSLINSVDSIFDGTIGYAANWDNYSHPNVTAALWDHPAIDFIGIDAYFTNLLSNSQADNSGTYPNVDFIGAVEAAWNNRLDNEILAFASARKGGAGMPIEFTEIGYLPRNRTTVTPQGESQPVDRDEQNMAFEGLMRALDGRLASGEVTAAHIWQWDMPGSGGSLWNMNPNGGNQPDNQQTAQWLSSFMNGTNPDHWASTPPVATQLLYSFETGLEGFSYPNFGGSQSSLAQATGQGATEGNHSLAITKTAGDWTWDARVNMSGTQLQAMQDALADDINNYVLTMDVTYIADDLPAGLTNMSLHVAFDPSPGSWTQAYPFAEINGPTNSTLRVEIPLGEFSLSTNFSSLALNLGFAGSWSAGDATVYIDNIALVNLAATNSADFNNDGVVDGDDLAVWETAFGATLGADADGDGVSDGHDFLFWQRQLGSGVQINSSAAIPEPSTAVLLLVVAAWCGGTRENSRKKLSL